ncbi:MAG TPA: cell division protein ZapA [Spirochaetales bacterium]|nr:cell division protein ZapA [Spirochaetales bacterium]
MSSTFSNADKPATQTIPIEILGVSFTIRTDEDEDYIHALVSELKERLSKVSGQMKVVDPLKLSLITNLLTLDEMHQKSGQKEKAQVSKDYEAVNLLDSLDKRLGELGL